MAGHNNTILVADDHAGNRQLLALLLDGAQYEVHLAADGCEAVDEMLKRVFDAVVTDWEMPKLSGSEFLTLCRVFWPNTPVIVVSAHAAGPGEGPHRHAFSWLQKPYEAQALLDVVQAAVEAGARRRRESMARISSEGCRRDKA